jgi:hypothetical protein
MRLQLILPHVEPREMDLPLVCPYERGQARHFRHYQEVEKRLKDREYDAVFAQRYQCLRWQPTFRLYPAWVTGGQAFFPACERPGRDAVPVGAEFWGDVPGLGSAGGLHV